MRRTLICTLTALALGLTPASSAWAVNSVMIQLNRIDDYVFPAAQFSLDMIVGLDLAATSVTIQAGSVALTLEESGPGSREWELVGDTSFADLAAVQAAIGGTWTLTITGPPSSTSTFTFNAVALVDGDFFPTATNLSPAHGAVNVSTTALLSWTDPTGVVTPYALSVEVANGLQFQTALSVPGLQEDIPITATSWQPPLALLNGPTEFKIYYIDADLVTAAAVVTAYQVTAGTITWGDSVFAPPGYPASTPLLGLGSETSVQFTVPEPSVALLSATALATVALLARRRRAASAIS